MKNWSLNFKVGFVLGLISIGAGVIAFAGINKMAFINEMLNNIVNNEVKRDQLTSLMLDQQQLIRITMRDVIIERDLEKMKAQEAKIPGLRENLLNYAKQYEESTTSPEGKALVEKYKNAVLKWNPIVDEIIKLAKQNKDAEVAKYRETVEAPVSQEMRGLIKDLNDRTAVKLKDAVKQAEETYTSARNLVIAISFISVFSAMALAFFIMRAVSRSIDQVIENLTDNSQQVSSASQQIASSSEGLSQAATEQAASLQQTAASIDEMSSMVQKNAENAKRTNEIATNSKKISEKGKRVVDEMIQAIDGINESNTTMMGEIDESNRKIAEIVSVISEIGNKTKVINDIVFQTKLLSFNASVEAARAGEHGKGFAVVAEEVGNLAQMSGNAAKEISALLDGSIQKVEGIVSETKSKVERLVQSGKEKVETGTRIAQECGSVLDEIVHNVSSVTEMAQEISMACQEQAQGVQEITKAMGQLDQVTQTNASTSEEAASAAEELSSQAEALKSVVDVLVSTIKGASSSQPTAHASVVPAQSKVLQFKKTRSTQSLKTVAAPSAGFKKAAGSDFGDVPSETDPRFEDV